MDKQQQKPVKARAGERYSCKACPPTKYFGIIVEYDQALVPMCPNCKKPTSLVERKA